MDSLNADQNKFDWDNISVGYTQLDHSQNFFARKHFEHERLDDIEYLQQKMIKTEISEDKENISVCSLPVNVQEIDNNLNAIKADESNKLIKEEKDLVKSPVDTNKAVLCREASCSKPNVILASEWSTKKTKNVCSKRAVTKNMPPPPNAYLVKDIYRRKRDEAERRRLEEERKMREFHSRPAPSFNNHTLQKRKPVCAVTVAVTPQVLKKSREVEEKRRKQLEEWKQKSQQPKFQPRPPTVLKGKPFVPEKKAFVLQQHPFNLQMEKRLQERRHYDETRQKAMEEKRKQVEIEEEERERLEKERIRELRKAATFKARPNPFKN